MLSDKYILRDKLINKALDLVIQACDPELDNVVAIRRCKQAQMILAKVPENVPEDTEEIPF